MVIKLHISRFSIIVFILGLFLSFAEAQKSQISLAGEWLFEIDKEDIGVRNKWHGKAFTSRVVLPGTMTSNGKGDDITLNTPWTASIYDSSYFFQPRLDKFRRFYNLKIPFWLTPDKHYVGPAWYRKEIIIPQEWEGKPVKLYIERVHTSSTIWLDDQMIDTTQNSLSTPHVYHLPSDLRPGKHSLTIRIDNRLSAADVGKDSHSVTDHTQGNWNGMIGQMYLEALPSIQIENVQIYPDKTLEHLDIVSLIGNGNKKQERVKLKYEIWDGDQILASSEMAKFASVSPDKSNELKHRIRVGGLLHKWDEFNPKLYTLKVIVGKVTKSYSFGLRHIGVEGKQIMLNGRRIFLRGDVNNCEFPLTGHPPMDVESWLAIFQKLKLMGINHIRFHSWCPPDAAFTAADISGTYLQPEAPTWPNHGTSLGDGRFIDNYIYEETNRMIEHYGNHPSFVMMAAGNEPAGRNQAKYLGAFVEYWKKKDNRRIYTGASVAMSWPLVPENEFMVKSAARGLDWKDKAPSSVDDYSEKIAQYPVPFVTHEQGQWCVFPDFSEIKEYTGVYKARNFELFKEDLKDRGMEKLADDFLMASGKLQALCYKMEIERSLRTKELSGFQLLGVQDFPGQGTATVGVLNAFYKEKPYITPEEFSQFCGPTVPLLKTEKFVWKTSETFKASVSIYHYGAENLDNTPIIWKLQKVDGDTIANGQVATGAIATSRVNEMGTLEIPLHDIKEAIQLKLTLELQGKNIQNSWNIWVYPDIDKDFNPQDIHVTDTLDFQAIYTLINGGKVFLNLHGKVQKGKEVIQSFTPVFWNTSWFKMRPPHTLGLVIDDESKAFQYFPTAYHSDLQWWEIVNNAQVMHLEDFPNSFKPLVRNIDTWFMNRSLATVFEAQAGNGKIIVSSADLLSAHETRPAAKQLFYSLIKYMQSEDFQPKEKVGIRTLMDLSRKKSNFVFDAFTKDAPDELKVK